MTYNFLDDLQKVANGEHFSGPPLGMDPEDEPELAPETRILVLDFPTKEQRQKASARILKDGRLKVRIPAD